GRRGRQDWYSHLAQCERVRSSAPRDLLHAPIMAESTGTGRSCLMGSPWLGSHAAGPGARACARLLWGNQGRVPAHPDGGSKSRAVRSRILDDVDADERDLVAAPVLGPMGDIARLRNHVARLVLSDIAAFAQLRQRARENVGNGGALPMAMNAGHACRLEG